MVTAGDATPLLALDRVSVRFGGLHALEGVSLDVRRGELLGLIGPNGAGKTTIFNVANGFHRPVTGSVHLHGVRVGDLSPQHRAAMGLARTFQNVEVFRRSSVRSNMLVGRHIHNTTPFLAEVLRLPSALRAEARDIAIVEEVIEFLDLEQSRHVAVGELSYGEKKLVEYGRALASQPDIVLVDEPASGMSRDEKEDIARYLLRAKHERGVTQVVVEHDVRFVRGICDRVVVLGRGRVVAEGPPDTVLDDPAVVDAYLGKRAGSTESDHRTGTDH